MNETKGARLADRLKAAAEARQALLAKFKPKPAAADPLFAERGVAAAAELKAVRAERQADRTVKKEAADAVAAGRRSRLSSAPNASAPRPPPRPRPRTSATPSTRPARRAADGPC